MVCNDACVKVLIVRANIKVSNGVEPLLAFISAQLHKQPINLMNSRKEQISHGIRCVVDVLLEIPRL